MTVIRLRPAATICLLTGTAVSIGLAGFVWAQAPAESFPFDDHSQAQTAQPAPPPKSAVQKRIEELYQHDGRPLPEYMQQNGASAQAAPNPYAAPGSQGGQIGYSAPSPVAGNAAPLRTQAAPAQSQGTVRQQLSDYYQSQGRTMPTPERTAGGYQYSSTQNGQPQPAPQPAQPRLIDRLNPFRHSTPDADAKPQAKAAPAPMSQPQMQQQMQAQHYAPAPATPQPALSDANHTAPNYAAANHPASNNAPSNNAGPMPQPKFVMPAQMSAQTAPPSAPAPAAKSGSFWGDLTLRRVPAPAADSQSPPLIAVELGTSGRLVPKSPAAAPAKTAVAQKSPVAPHPAAVARVDVAPPVVVAAPAVVVPATVIPVPAVAAMPADVHASGDANQKVSATAVVPAADDSPMPFRESSEVDADQKGAGGPYTGLTLEDEQSQLLPPGDKSAAPKPASPSHAVAAGADSHQGQSAKSAAAPAQSSASHSQSVHIEPAAPALPQRQIAKSQQQHPQTPAEKLQLIGERVGQKGLKGFCPVVLRDQRELADARPGFCSMYESHKYCFSSADAKARFDAAPQKYAPVAGGIDVVVKVNSDQVVEGTLDFALWYKEHLYLFTSPESLQAFSLSPAAYAAAVQRLH